MKDIGSFFRWFYVAGSVLFLTALGIALMIWRDPAVLIGLAAGYAITVVPLAGWHLIVRVTDGLARKDRIWIAVAIGAAKLAGLGLTLYYLMTRDLVNVYALIAGTAMVIPVLMILSTMWNRSFAK